MFIILFFISSKTYSESYAILVSAGITSSDDQAYHSEYWYDLIMAYRDLILKENYTHDRVLVFYGNGSDWTGSSYAKYRPSTYGWSNIVDFNNSYNTMNTQIRNFANSISSNDNILIHWVCGHGSHNGSSSNPDNYQVHIENQNEEIQEADLIAMFNQIINYERRKIIWMTCNSGCLVYGNLNFNNDKTVIITASNFNQSSYSQYFGQNYTDPHTELDWVITSALYGGTPLGAVYNGDHDNDKIISMGDLWLECSGSSIMSSTPQLGDNSQIRNKIFVNEHITFSEGQTLNGTYQYQTDQTNLTNTTVSNSANIIFSADN